MGFFHPLISVIIPTYNRERLIMRAVKSVLEQDYQNVEVIVVDDGSTDNTKSLFESQEDSRVRYRRIEHGGACAARNAGLEMANGKYISFLDSDDIYFPNKLSTQLRSLMLSRSDIVFCAFERDNNGKKDIIPSNLKNGTVIRYESLIGGNVVGMTTMLGKRKCFLEERFDPDFPRFQDWDLVLRLAKKYRILFYDDVLLRQYVQSDSIFHNRKAFVEGVLRVIMKNVDAYAENKQCLCDLLQVVINYTNEE